MALRNAQGQRGKYLTRELSSTRNPVEDMCAIVSKFQSAKIGAVCSWCPSRAHDLVAVPRPHQGLWSPGPPLREFDKAASGSPTFPSYPCEDMPRSETPVVS